MANDTKPIVAMQHVPLAAAAAHTASATQKTKITGAQCTDQATGASTLTLWLVPDAGARANSNRIVNAKPFTAAQSLTITELIGRILPIGTTIHWQASVAGTDLSMQIDGVLFTDPT